MAAERLRRSVFAALLWAAGCSQGRNDPQGLSVHPAGWLDPASALFHGGSALAAARDGHTSFCQACHGADYSGGTSGVSCVACHAGRGDSECTPCHGGYDNRSGAPPANLLGDTAVAGRGVGAHTTMVEGFALSSGFDCAHCHRKPGFVLAPGHFEPADLAADSAQAEVSFSAFADPGGAAYDPATATCSGTYCHGTFPGGRARVVAFGGRVAGSGDTALYLDFSQAACGSCHAVTAAGGWDSSHARHTRDLGLDCVTCHRDVATLAPAGRVLDRGLHVNGLKDVRFDLAAGPGAVWDASAKSCASLAFGCHSGQIRAWNVP